MSHSGANWAVCSLGKAASCRFNALLVHAVSVDHPENSGCHVADAAEGRVTVALSGPGSVVNFWLADEAGTAVV